MTLSEIELVEWDSGNLDHFGRHGLRCRDVDEVLSNPIVFTRLKADPTRFKILGYNDGGRLLTVVGSYDPRRRAFRPITGWATTPSERERYSK